MAPLPENNTGRLWIQYTSQNIGHEMMLRYDGIQSTPNLIAFYDLFAPFLASAMVTSDSVTGARFSSEGTNFSSPLPVDPVAGTKAISGNIWAEDPESAQVSFVGRSGSDGRRFRVLFFTPYRWGTGAPWPTDNRYQAGENTEIDTFIGLLQSFAEGGGSIPFPLVTIGGSSFVVYTYANICKNGYWEKEQRG